MGKKVDTDRRIAWLAARQHGVLSVAQLAEAGLGQSGAARRVRAGRLHRIHRGVYAVGHGCLSDHGRWWAALLACGPRAVLSHRSAAALWGFLPAGEGPVHVTVAGSGGRNKRPGIRVHRPRLLPADAIGRRAGIPVTTPARTLEDLRSTLQAAELRRAHREAAVLGFERAPPELERTRSELELEFLTLCRQHRLPQPQVNVRLDDFLVDFLWPQSRLVAELDGYRYHRGRAAFERDRARDAKLATLGYRVLRFTQRQLSGERRAVVAALRALLPRHIDSRVNR